MPIELYEIIGLFSIANSPHAKPKDSPKLLPYIIASQVFINCFLKLSLLVPFKNLTLGWLQNLLIFKNRKTISVRLLAIYFKAS